MSNLHEMSQNIRMLIEGHLFDDDLRIGHKFIFFLNVIKVTSKILIYSAKTYL